MLRSCQSHHPLSRKLPTGPGFGRPHVVRIPPGVCISHAGKGDASSGNDKPQPAPSSDNSVNVDKASAATPAYVEDATPKSWPQKIKEFFLGSSMDRAKLANLGMGAFAAYGVISNLNYGIAIAISWLGFVKVNGVSPLAPGQWKPFLAYYAGMWAIQNFARPMRLAAALALAPTFDRGLTTFTEKTGLPKGVAFAGMLLVIGLATSATLFSTLYFMGGFPPTP